MRDRRYSATKFPADYAKRRALSSPQDIGFQSKTKFAAHYLLSPIPYLLSPICIAHEGLSGGAGRQALVGNAWHAPLPLLLQTPFAKASALYLFLLAAIVALAVFRHLRRVAEQMTEGNREQGIGNRGQGSGKYLLSPISYLLSPICAVAVGAAVVTTAAPTATALFVLSILKLLDWAREKRLRDWVLLSFLLGALVLCGLPYIGWVVAIVLLLPLLIALDKRVRSRTGGLMFLCLAPVLYAAGCWLLLSYLILDDPFFAWRFVADLHFGPLPRTAVWTAAGAAAVAAIAVAVHHKIGDRRLEIGDRRYRGGQISCENAESEESRKEGKTDAAEPQKYLTSHISHLLSPICAAASVTAATAIWFGTLSAAALDWALPWGAPANLAPPDRDAVARHVREATPWGRVFVCGYAGLGGRCTDPADDALFESCLDLHIADLRVAYTRQKLYLLVPKPARENALEPCEWRYGGIYFNGAQRLLLDRDFGDWRLYEVVSAEFADGTEPN